MNRRLCWGLVCMLWGISCRADAAGAVELKSPLGGWRNASVTEDADDQVHASYPKPPVDRGGQRQRALIEGVLKRLGTDQRPGRYVVNGINMPLYTDEQGRFVKPWAFGPGSNNVEVVAPDGTRKRVQFYATHSNQTRAKLRIVMGWNDAKAEVDMHIITPSGGHAFWANPRLQTGGGLDVDSVDGGGPEIFSTATPEPGLYLVYVNYWGNFTQAGYNFEHGSNEKQLITTRFTIVHNENTPDERMETATVPLRRMGDLTFVRAVRIGDQR